MAWYKPFFLFGISFLIFISAHGQENRIATSIDSLLERIVIDRDTVISNTEPKPSFEGSIKKAQDYTLILNEMNQVLKKEIDTTKAGEVIPNAQKFLQRISETFAQDSIRINLRYMTALENILAYNRTKIEVLGEILTLRREELVSVREKLDSIQRDELLKYNLRDTTILLEYQTTIKTLKAKVSLTDSILDSQRFSTAILQNRVSTTLNEIILREEDLRQARVKLEKGLFDKENNYLWQPNDFPDSKRVIDVFLEAFRINSWIINNYINRNLGLTFFFCFAVLVLYFFVRRNLDKIKKEKEFSAIIIGRLKYLNRFPLLSSLVVILALAPFFYPFLPAAFFALILFFLVTSAVFLLKNRLTNRGYSLVLFIYVLFFFSTLSNLYWQVAFQERWHLIVFNFLGIFLGWKMIKVQKEDEENIPPYFKKLILVYIIFEAVSFIANVFGRFSLSKLIGIAGTISLMHAVSLIIFVIILKEIIYIQIEVSKKNNVGFTSAVDFNDIQRRVNRFFAYLAIVIWGYSFLESMHLLDSFLDGMFSFLNKQRSILNATFTFTQIVVFFLVIYTSAFFANTIAFIATMKDESKALERNTRLGSSILLIRLAILSIGFFIAIASSGIPVDKIAIVLGALSVGIGFGLQTIVNNLVSGIILAFERPIQIGDTIQVGVIEGVVKDIGIRASKIKNWDGAEVIIPNGDLLANHLTNWTLSDKTRRVELIIGVAYNTDMDLVTELIQKQLAVDNIMAMPQPKVFLQTFGENSVNFRVLFWVNDVDIWVSIRDQVMRGVFKSFKENGIEIPFPQRDLHVKSFPGLIEEKVMRPSQIENEEKPKVNSSPDKNKE